MSWPDWLGQQHWQGEEFCEDTFDFFKVIFTGPTARGGGGGNEI